MTSANQPEAARQAVRELLVARAGGFLSNVVRQPGITCSVCATFVAQKYPRCYQCNRHTVHGGLADLVVPLTYGVADAQSGYLMHAYKRGSAGHSRTNVALLLMAGLMQHERCVSRAVGERCEIRVTLPTLSRRAGIHPLRSITEDIGITSPDLLLIPDPGAGKSREVTDGAFSVSNHSLVEGRHVMVIDDTWVTGGSAQSAALALRRAGATHVTILVGARWVNLGYQPTSTLAKAHLVGDFDPLHCPVTGGACP